jgi:hypothetical protein
MRPQLVTSWADVDFEKMQFHVRQKQDVGFTPKNHEKRTVPAGEPGLATKAAIRTTAL